MAEKENVKKLKDEDLDNVSGGYGGGGYVVPSAQDCIDTCGNCDSDGYCSWHHCNVSEMVGRECGHCCYF